MTVLSFTEGTALANMGFDSAPNDPLDARAVSAIDHMQDDAMKSGLPSQRFG